MKRPLNSSIYTDIDRYWDHEILPTLMQYISIPCLSPAFDGDWHSHGHIDQAVQLVQNWCLKQPVSGMTLKVIQQENRTPILFIDVEGTVNETVLLYGHLDKQPEMSGWDRDLGPWKPVLKGDKLYGRGGADDGYAIFAALSALLHVQKRNLPHPRCVILIEACEESGSYDLPHYLNALETRIGKPSLVIGLDSGCGNYDQLWCTTSLRGVLNGTLAIEVLSEGIHSGVGSGVVPSPFLVLRQLLERVENTPTGRIQLDELHVSIPDNRKTEIKETAQLLGEDLKNAYPFLAHVRPLSEDIEELLLNRSWRPSLSVVGMDGIPPVAHAGNVTLPSLTAGLSFRLPPTLAPQRAIEVLKDTFEKETPFGAHVRFHPGPKGSGWNAPPFDTWLKTACHEASLEFFGNPAATIGEGGSIPFMGMLGRRFPEAQFLITGVLGPKSNAHGPNEFLHIPMVKKLTGCIAHVLSAHAEAYSVK